MHENEEFHTFTGVMDALSDVSMVTEGEGDKGDNSFSQVDNSHPVLMTPDAFKSSPRHVYVHV